MGVDRDEGAIEDVDEELDDELDDDVDPDVPDDDGTDDDTDDDGTDDDTGDDVEVVQQQTASPGFFGRLQWTPLLLVQAAHAKQAIVTALVMGGVAVLADRPAQEAGVVLLTVLVGQTILGWHNDIVDKARDEAHRTPRKPIADGRLDPGAAWYAIVVAALILVPLSITTGITAGAIYLVSVCVGMLGNVVLRTGFFSWVTWAVSFAMLPAYLSYGGWGGQAVGEPPETAITILAALLGIGVHFMRAVWGLVADHEDGWTYLPLKLGLKLGATRLLALSTLYTVGIAVALGVVGYQQGLSQ
ncbi:UbiA family prenyltransferase [Nocardioides bizhenqiangii]|uniref:UbiA family prenyltransferase n=1 Tax=Nocardioides bizhenqiangii TaxID=3095076 RepID=A0ABZ0ZQX5_9ACTN|nr:UbiA family prenyltransferase [Nocardioides sp. HM61]WQQ25883.1 UbiA family prenyltransferase [Nocardioides sp. HM61]